MFLGIVSGENISVLPFYYYYVHLQPDMTSISGVCGELACLKTWQKMAKNGNSYESVTYVKQNYLIRTIICDLGLKLI